jgi:hypothetical protein
MSTLDPDVAASELKTIAHDLGATALRASFRTERDQWITVEVRHAGLLSDSRDGWDTEITKGEL